MSRTRRTLALIGALLLAPVAAHVGVQLATHTPAPAPIRADSDDARSYVRMHGGILQVGLEGDAQSIGTAHATLLHQEMVENETALWGVFHDLVPTPPLRFLLLDLARVRFRHLSASFGPYRHEVAAAARAYGADPFSHVMPTYQRMLFLNALYDISLSFEHSPLIGCSSVVVPTNKHGHTLLGRNFDFETHPIFDSKKAVLLFKQRGRIPFASVAWPGLMGVVTGLNAKGVGIVVHGARAGEADPAAEPVLLSVRDALSSASTMEQAVNVVASRNPMVSHLLLIADATGESAVVERAPGRPAHVRRSHQRTGLSNHFEGPLADDPANQRVLNTTSTLARRARLDELIARLPEGVAVADVASVLRDQRGKGDVPLREGDRDAIDAGIATHGVVMDLASLELWVSRGPHLDGSFVRFDIARMLSDDYEPEELMPAEELR